MGGALINNNRKLFDENIDPMNTQLLDFLQQKEIILPETLKRMQVKYVYFDIKHSYMNSLVPCHSAS